MIVSEKWTKYDRVVEQLLEVREIAESIDTLIDERETLNDELNELRMKADHDSGIQIKEDPETKEIERSTPSNVRLPKLEIRKYNGDPHDWQRFHEEFSNSIHTNKNLSTIEKFSYLRSLLIANAAAAIEGLPLDVANQLANQLEVHVRGLEALQTSAEAYQAFLMPMILPSLPRELAVEWKRRRSERRDNVGCVPTIGRRSTLLQTARARVHDSNGNSMVVNCLFDSGSQRSFVKKSVADALSLEGPMERVFIESLGGDHNKCKRTRRVKFRISSLNGKDDKKQLIEALCLPKICQKPKLVPNFETFRLKHLTALQLADDFTGNSGAFDVPIGCIICGPMTNEKREPTSFSHSAKVLYAKVDEQLDEAIRKFWEIETIGMMDGSDKADIDSTRAVQNFESTLQFDGIRYTVRLPWLEDDAQLPNNYHQALTHHERGMREYLEEDFVEEVTDRTGYPGRIWYLPHHAVIREDKTTTKCRIVFDGSAQYGGVTLNRHLDVGPALQNDLVKVLLRFRRFRIGLQADISKMFLQIGLNEQYRDVCRFLWRSCDVQEAPRIYRFKRLYLDYRVHHS
ncbi:hypothetical protein T4C_9370 [Trichinella pseudospiralis]|uniref:Uncharacterized protein n=1 Tax=Trichinella pseudospiralis TaxID=6337 RepID=A0A0V1JVQ0_TRIPS|nr:hypothetical protein T4C_9370 [Trichinella pseudospiralis]